jgi:alpha-beta hydrolase superfamily lysophospholipase
MGTSTGIGCKSGPAFHATRTSVGFLFFNILASLAASISERQRSCDMPPRRFDFTGAQGQRLAGRLDMPDAPPIAHALFAHCFTCGKDIFAASRLSAALNARGLVVLRFDFTGLGSSEGEFGNGGLTSNVEDLIAAASALSDAGFAANLLIGHSLGGAAVLAAAHALAEVRAVVTIGAPFDASHVLALFQAQLPAIETAGKAEVRLGGRTFTIERRFVEDVRAQHQGERIAQLGKALLVLHSPSDAIVGIENAALIFQHARHPKSFVSLDDADHLLSRQRDADYAAGIIAAWSMRYLPSKVE